MSNPPAKTVLLAVPAHERLSRVRQQIQEEIGRPPSYSEVVERLLDLWEQRQEGDYEQRQGP